jgi:hypothetical protein
MLTVTWTYERLTQEYPFYMDTPEGAAFQEIIDTIRQNSGLVISREISRTEDGLTLVSVYNYESVAKCREFTSVINSEISTYFSSRDNYLIKCGHKLTGISNEPAFATLIKLDNEPVVVVDETKLELTRVLP